MYTLCIDLDYCFTPKFKKNKSTYLEKRIFSSLKKMDKADFLVEEKKVTILLRAIFFFFGQLELGKRPSETNCSKYNLV